jgi:hypothetical protein
MTRQKSENSIVPEGLRKLPPTELARGGKGIPVDKEMVQSELVFAVQKTRKGLPTESGVTVMPLSERSAKGDAKSLMRLSTATDCIGNTAVPSGTC